MRREVNVGDELPVFERIASLEAWNRYAAVNDEFIPIHMDDAAGQAAGFAAAFGMGNLQVAYLHALVRQWAGEAGCIISVSCRLRSPSFRGLLTIARGEVTSVTGVDEERRAHLKIWTETETREVLAEGTAVVALGAEF